jgi:hypothetical protein
LEQAGAGELFEQQEREQKEQKEQKERGKGNVPERLAAPPFAGYSSS